MPEPNHGHHHDTGHIPPPDLPQHRTMFGFRPHVFVGGLVLIGLLFLYLLLYVNGSPWVRHAAPVPAATQPAPAR